MRYKLIVLLLLISPTIPAAEVDPETGLIIATHWELARANCTACHSAKLVIQNRMSRDGWQKTIRWMQEKHNLWDLGDNEPAILDYLSTHYRARTTPAIRRRNLVLGSNSVNEK